MKNKLLLVLGITCVLFLTIYTAISHKTETISSSCQLAIITDIISPFLLTIIFHPYVVKLFNLSKAKSGLISGALIVLLPNIAYIISGLQKFLTFSTTTSISESDMYLLTLLTLLFFFVIEILLGAICGWLSTVFLMRKESKYL
jgi:hypothetical protein